jgi:diguanylate cyclase (GGDEF)-like protein
MRHSARPVSSQKLTTPEMDRSLGLLFVSGPVLALIWLVLLPHTSVEDPWVFLSVCGLSAVVGLWLLICAHRPRPLLILHMLIVAAVVLVSIAVIAAGSNRGLAIFYLFVSPFTWAYFSTRAAVLHTAFTGSVSLATLLVQRPLLTTPELTDVLGRWSFIMVCLLSVGLLIRVRTASLRRAIAGQARQADVSRVLAGFMERAIERNSLAGHYQDAVETIVGVLNASMAAVVVRGSDGALRLATSVGANTPAPPGTVLDDSGEMVDFAVRHGGILVSDDLRSDKRFTAHRLLLEDGQRSAVLAPIQRDGTVVGFLQAFSREVGAFDTKDALTLTSFAATLSQVANRAATDEEMARRALYDSLTGLPNRALFAERLSQAVARRTPGGYEGELAVIFADIDRFKDVNDTYGHLVGDHLLVTLAPRLAALMRDGDMVARFGGDEFVFLLEGIGDSGDAMQAALRLSEAAQRVPIVMPDGLVTHISLSIGVSLSRERIDCVDAMMAEADEAMYLAKGAGGGQVRLFEDSDLSAKRNRLLMESQLRRALQRGEVSVAYQPIVNVTTSTPVGFEALARWDHHERGPVSPEEFIPVAEHAGLIGELDELVLRTACTDVAHWQQATGRPLTISVNVSSRHLAQTTFAERLLAAHADSNLLPGTLCLEITETALILDTVGASLKLAALHAAGVKISLDDFGTGYSSLAHLRDFPIHSVKIDRSFVSNVLTNDDDAAIVEGVTVMARRMGLSAVAEGVENVAVHERLKELGCPLAQGHLYASALPRAAVDDYLGDALARVSA